MLSKRGNSRRQTKNIDQLVHSKLNNNNNNSNFGHCNEYEDENEYEFERESNGSMSDMMECDTSKRNISISGQIRAKANDKRFCIENLNETKLREGKMNNVLIQKRDKNSLMIRNKRSKIRAQRRKPQNKIIDRGSNEEREEEGENESNCLLRQNREREFNSELNLKTRDSSVSEKEKEKEEEERKIKKKDIIDGANEMEKTRLNQESEELVSSQNQSSSTSKFEPRLEEEKDRKDSLALESDEALNGANRNRK